MNHLKPKRRSKARAWAGITAHTLRKHWYWLRNASAFSARQNSRPLAYLVASHRTPLLRELSGVDMRYQRNKITNLRIATARINGLVIEPGKKFSYWKCIGAVTREKGYLDGIELYYGTFRPGIGGGLCQLSNLLYWMLLHTPLSVTERHRHSYDVFPDAKRTQPFGSGATCYYPFLDLEALNPTGEEFQIVLRVTDEYLEGEIRSNKPLEAAYVIEERDHRFTPEWWGGYSRHNKIVRHTYRDGRLAQSEDVTENHAICMYSPFLEKKPSAWPVDLRAVLESP